MQGTMNNNMLGILLHNAVSNIPNTVTDLGYEGRDPLWHLVTYSIWWQKSTLCELYLS